MALFFVCAAPSQAASRDGVGGLSSSRVKDVGDLLTLVRHQERLARYVTGKSFGGRTTFNSGATRADQAVIAFAREADPRGRIRLDYDPRIAETQDGRRFHDSQVCGYDGRLTWILKRAQMLEGRDEKPFPLREAQVMHDRGAILVDDRTGWSSTLIGFYEARGAWFSELLERPEVPFELRPARGREDGDVVLACRSRGGATEEWELALAWRYALRRYTRTDPSGRVLRTLTVESAVQVHPDFWYPTKIVGLSQDSRPGVSHHLDVEVAEVSLAESLPAAHFEPRFPHGTPVHDTATGKVIVVAAPDDELEKILGAEATEMQRLVLYEPESSWWPRMLAGAGLVAGVVLLVRRGARRRVALHGEQRKEAPRRTAASRPAGLMLFALCGVLCPAAAQEPWGLRFLSGHKGDNCAVNAVALISRYFGCATSLATLSDRLGCSTSRIEAIGLDRIAATLGHLGLEVRGFREADLDDVRQLCVRERSVAVVHLTTAAAAGHYLVIAPAAGGLVVGNPSYGIASHAMESAHVQRLAERFTGSGVLVRQSGRTLCWTIGTAATHARFIGRIPAREHSELIAVRNDGIRPLNLRSAEAGCGCIRSVELRPNPLEPGTDGLLVLTVDGRHVSERPSQQTVLLTLVDGTRDLTRELVLDVSGEKSGSELVLEPA